MKGANSPKHCFEVFPMQKHSLEQQSQSALLQDPEILKRLENYHLRSASVCVVVFNSHVTVTVLNCLYISSFNANSKKEVADLRSNNFCDHHMTHHSRAHVSSCSSKSSPWRKICTVQSVCMIYSYTPLTGEPNGGAKTSCFISFGKIYFCFHYRSSLFSLHF